MVLYISQHWHGWRLLGGSYYALSKIEKQIMWVERFGMVLNAWYLEWVTYPYLDWLRY